MPGSDEVGIGINPGGGALIQTEIRLGGFVLLLSVVALAAGFALIAKRGQTRGLTASFRGVEEIGRNAVALTTSMKALAVFGLLQLVGFGVLASALVEVGELTLAFVSYGLWRTKAQFRMSMSH